MLPDSRRDECAWSAGCMAKPPSRDGGTTAADEGCGTGPPRPMVSEWRGCYSKSPCAGAASVPAPSYTCATRSAAWRPSASAQRDGRRDTLVERRRLASASEVDANPERGEGCYRSGRPRQLRRLPDGALLLLA